MATISIPKREYRRLRQYSAAYLRITEELARTERAYPYDYPHISALTRKVLAEHRKGKSVTASSVDAALTRFRRGRR